MESVPGRFLRVISCLTVVWCAVIAGVLPAYAGVTTNSIDRLASSALPDWTAVSGGANRSGIWIRSVNNTLWYERSAISIDNRVAFQFEAVLSAEALAGDGERGARMWVWFRDDSLPPDTVYKAELRLVRAGGAYLVHLVDGYDGTLRASIPVDWTRTGPRWRVRIKRQQVAGTDYILLQAEPSNVWDNPDQPNNLNDVYSQATPVSGSFVADSGWSQIGFGNYLSGSYSSYWESVHLTTCDDDTTILPYWPPAPPAPVIVFDNKGTGNPQAVFFSANCTGTAYLINDSVTPYLDANGTTLTGDTRTPPADEDWYFDGLNDNQTVYGRVAASDISGRSRVGADASAVIESNPCCGNTEVSPHGSAFPMRLVADSSSYTGYYLYFEKIASAVGYNIYEGALGTWYNHGTANPPANCASGAVEDLGTGEMRLMAMLSSVYDTYYLVTTYGATAEGPSGFDGNGVEIPAGQNTCLP